MDSRARGCTEIESDLAGVPAFDAGFAAVFDAVTVTAAAAPTEAGLAVIAGGRDTVTEIESFRP